MDGGDFQFVLFFIVRTLEKRLIGARLETCKDFLLRPVLIGMKYKDYEAAVDFDDELEMFHGSVVNTRDVITFYGKSVAELKREFRNSVDDYLKFCKERGEEPDRPLSGNLMVNISPSLHKRLYSTAKRNGTSLNALIEEKLASV